jgi:hypothetical protein
MSVGHRDNSRLEVMAPNVVRVERSIFFRRALARSKPFLRWSIAAAGAVFLLACAPGRSTRTK